MISSSHDVTASSCRFRTLLCSATILGVLLTSGAHAINIRIHLDSNTSENPGWDPSGSLLKATFEAAALIWEDLLPGGGTFDVNVEWDDDIDGLGLWTDIPAIWDDNLIEINPDYDWYYDPTPLDHSEFDFVTKNSSGDTFRGGQWLYRDISASQQSSWFNDNPPGLLEVGYRGYATSGTLQTKCDLLRRAAHTNLPLGQIFPGLAGPACR